MVSLYVCGVFCAEGWLPGGGVKGGPIIWELCTCMEAFSGQVLVGQCSWQVETFFHIDKAQVK